MSRMTYILLWKTNGDVLINVHAAFFYAMTVDGDHGLFQKNIIKKT